MTFKFGGTYKDSCDMSISEHLQNYEKQTNRQHDLKQSAQGFPKLQTVKQDNQVRDRLNTYRDGHVGRSTMIGNKLN